MRILLHYAVTAAALTTSTTHAVDAHLKADHEIAEDMCLEPMSLLHRDAALLRGTALKEPQVFQLLGASLIGNDTQTSPMVAKTAEVRSGSVGSTAYNFKRLLQALSTSPGVVLTELSRTASSAHRDRLMAETQLDATVWLILILLAILLVILGYLYHNDWDTKAAGHEAEAHARYAAEQMRKGTHAAAVVVEKQTRKKDAKEVKEVNEEVRPPRGPATEAACRGPGTSP